MLNYYGKFTPNLANILHPLKDLLKADKKWEWTQDCWKAFTRAKEQLSSAKVLTYYDPRMPLNLPTDASAYGIGAVASHVFLMGLNDPLPSCHVRCLQVNGTMPKSRRKLSHLSLVSKSSTSTCTDDTSISSQTTSHSPPSLDQRKVYLHWLQLDYRDGRFFSEPTPAASHTSQQTCTVMQMVSRDSLYPPRLRKTVSTVS